MPFNKIEKSSKSASIFSKKSSFPFINVIVILDYNVAILRELLQLYTERSEGADILLQTKYTGIKYVGFCLQQYKCCHQQFYFNTPSLTRK